MKLGIVGHGSIGSRHAANAEQLGHKVLVYDPANRRDVEFERNIYERCDAVVIATPTIYHLSGIRACAERGKHVLVEKPIARSDHGLRELLDLAASKSAIVMMGNNLRFHPCVHQAKQWIDEGYIGDPLWASFACAALSAKAPYLSDGVILNTGAHEVDLALFLLGPATVISAYARCSEHGDDIARFTLEHESGCLSTFLLDFVTPNEIREAWIAGSEKNIGIDFLGRRTSLGSVSTGHNGSFDQDYIDEMCAFIDRIEGKAVPGATGDDGLATLKVLLDVRKMAGLE